MAQKIVLRRTMARTSTNKQNKDMKANLIHAAVMAAGIVSDYRNQAPIGFDPKNMAKETKTSEGAASEGLDLSKLTPEQLQSLQKQLKERKANTTGKTKERFLIIDTMLAEKDDKEGFKWTTRDIINKLAENNLVDQTVPKWDQIEIKKVQARKQHLEKLTDEKGKLVHPEGKFGYKASAGVGFAMTPVTVSNWFAKAENVAKLTGDQRNAIVKALGSKK